MVSEANEPGSENGKRSDAPQEGGASNHLAARLAPRSPGSFAAAIMITTAASWGPLYHSRTMLSPWSPAIALRVSTTRRAVRATAR